jgi:hypothetical protein
MGWWLCVNKFPKWEGSSESATSCWIQKMCVWAREWNQHSHVGWKVDGQETLFPVRSSSIAKQTWVVSSVVVLSVQSHKSLVKFCFPNFQRNSLTSELMIYLSPHLSHMLFVTKFSLCFGSKCKCVRVKRMFLPTYSLLLVCNMSMSRLMIFKSTPSLLHDVCHTNFFVAVTYIISGNC